MAFQQKSEFKRGKETLAAQLAAQLREAIESGELRPGDRLPATRRLAADLGFSRGTVATAFELLIAEGMLDARTGSGTYVSADALAVFDDCTDLAPDSIPTPRPFPAPAVDIAREARLDFRPCRPSTAEFPLQAWRRSLSFAASSIPPADYGDPRGSHALREEIARYLRRARGMRANPDQIIITNGAVHAMHLLASVYLATNDVIVFEDPGYPLARQTFELAGAQVHLCRVDNEGIVLDDLPQIGESVRLVYVTPSHQFPTGSRLSLGRRQELVKWAAHNGALIVEDDYDGEFRYDVPPLAPMAAMAPNVVVYCGTFSKTMFPGLRIGYAVAGEHVINALADYRTLTEYAPCAITQAALCQFIATGDFERHVQKMRRIYGAKRQAVQSALSNTCIDASVSGIESGLHALIELDSQTSAERLSKLAAADGILLPPLSHYSRRQSMVSNSLVFGYAAATLSDIETGISHVFGA